MGVPRHVAIIMDGNGRWATQRGLPRAAGHEEGAESVREIVRACGKLGVEVLTLYSFSTENWRRPEEEVEALMALLHRYLREELGELTSNKVRLLAIGQLERLPAHVRGALEYVIEATAEHTGLKLVLALSYGSRHEMVRAVRAIARRAAAGQLDPDEVDDAMFASELYTAGLPDPDFVIRTSGEQRLSNFLLWQVAYAEILITDTPWPEFRRPELEAALAVFGERERRFGKTGAQVAAEPE
jgi:undecaprenyl diphosphate synthase